ncbi:MAG: sigma 54-interacting transcriptional regulator [Polyangiales bacterium]
MERTDTSTLADDPNKAAQSARLLIEEPERPARTMLLVPGASVRIGRAADLEVCLDDTRASRVHAIVRYEGGAVRLEDRESSNGTWLGDERVKGTVTLASGGQFRVGGTRVTVLLPDRSAAGRSAARALADDAFGLVAVDPATTSLLDLARRLGPSELSVIIQGETGVGKELLARAIHRAGPRATKPFLVVNCATLGEEALFGREDGDSGERGALEAAHGGTVLLDEVADLTAAGQARLLRVLQERAVTRVGGSRPVPVDVRVVATATRDVAREVAAGRFREDLYFRLNGVTLEVPPLRQRPRDVLPIAQRALDEARPGLTLAQGVAAVLSAHRWPGNARELVNAMRSAAAVADGATVRVEHLPASVRGEAGGAAPQVPLRERVDETERKAIVAALESTRWNQSRAARVLGISRRALIYKMERYGLKPLPNSQRHA